MRKFYIVAFFAFIFFSSLAQSPIPVDAVYIKQLENWQNGMSRWKLRNFVPLVGLHLLKEGNNTFGSGESNDIVINTPNAPETIGSILMENGKLSFTAKEGVEPKLAGKFVKEINYTFDEDHNTERLRERFITWYVQHVGDDYLLRIMDDESPEVRAYEPHDYYPANEDFIFSGKYKPYKTTKELKLENVIDTWQKHTFTGEVTFKYKGKKQKLMVIGSSFIMFSDETNGETTFPFGRYLRVDTSDPKNVIIDFNHAFSPPRSSNLHTTCDIPPPANHLNFSVFAGEMFDSKGKQIIRPLHK